MTPKHRPIASGSLLLCALGTAILVVLGSVSPAQASASMKNCDPARAVFSYTSSRASAQLTLPPCPKLARSVGTLALAGVLRREPLLLAAQSANRKDKCNLWEQCKLTVDIEHDDIDAADYEASFTYRSENGNIVGGVRFARTCITLAVERRCWE